MITHAVCLWHCTAQESNTVYRINYAYEDASLEVHLHTELSTMYHIQHIESPQKQQPASIAFAFASADSHVTL